MCIPETAEAMTFIVTSDRDRAKRFYGTILGFELVHEDDFAAVFDLNGTALRISAATDFTPKPHTVLGWKIDDIADTARALGEKGVMFERYNGLEQDELGVWSPPGSLTKVAWFTDPDGNVLSLTQFG